MTLLCNTRILNVYVYGTGNYTPPSKKKPLRCVIRYPMCSRSSRRRKKTLFVWQFCIERLEIKTKKKREQTFRQLLSERFGVCLFSKAMGLIYIEKKTPFLFAYKKLRVYVDKVHVCCCCCCCCCRGKSPDHLNQKPYRPIATAKGRYMVAQKKRALRCVFFFFAFLVQQNEDNKLNAMSLHSAASSPHSLLKPRCATLCMPCMYRRFWFDWFDSLAQGSREGTETLYRQRRGRHKITTKKLQ